MAKNNQQNPQQRKGGQAIAANRREALRAQQAADAARARRNRLLAVIAGVLALVVVAGVIGVVVYRHNHRSASTPQITPPSAVGNNGGMWLAAKKTGVPTLTVFQDYQCPVCKEVEGVVGGYTNELVSKGEINVIYRTQTFLDSNFSSTASLRAAMGAACADTVGHYRAYHDAVYANQPAQEGAGYSDQLLRATIPGQIGITGANLAKFQACYDAKSTNDVVTATAAQADKDNTAGGTPFYQVNGKTYDWRTFQGMTEAQFLAGITKLAS